MATIDNINKLWGDDLKHELGVGVHLQVAAPSFSVYTFEALKAQLELLESFEFLFTQPTFVSDEIEGSSVLQHKEFFIPKRQREKSLYGGEFEIQLKNKLTQKAVSLECARWIRKKACFKSNQTKQPMQSFACIKKQNEQIAYMPVQGFTSVDLGYQKGSSVSNLSTKTSGESAIPWLNIFEQMWSDTGRTEDVTDAICEHIASVYKENSPEKLYFFILYHIFNEFLDSIDQSTLPKEKTGYENSVIWQKLFRFQKDAAMGIINKLETHGGCILADSVGLGKTFTALAAIKYYELRNDRVLVLCPKKLADNWQTYRGNLTTNILVKDNFRYDVLAHTDLQRTRGESAGLDLGKLNWGNYDLVVIDESHNFRNNKTARDHSSEQDQKSRYQKLFQEVIKKGVDTKVLMLSATPVNNRFHDLRNQLALIYETRDDGAQKLDKALQLGQSVDSVFAQAQMAFKQWSQLPAAERTPGRILNNLNFDFFKLLDALTIARSRKHIESCYDMSELGQFPDRLSPRSFCCPLTDRKDVISLTDIYQQLSELNLSVYAPMQYVHPSRLPKYEQQYDTEVKRGGKLKHKDREHNLRALLRVNLLKRLESSAYAFRLTLEALIKNYSAALKKLAQVSSGTDQSVLNVNIDNELLDDLRDEDEDIDQADDDIVGSRVQISLSDMDCVSWKRDLESDNEILKKLRHEICKISPEDEGLDPVDDKKLQQLKQHIIDKIQNPINPGNKKVLIFTAFTDTARYLYNNLHRPLLKMGLHMGLVTGGNEVKNTLKKDYYFQEILTLFSPRSKDKDIVLPDEEGEIDIVIGTDCISEGQNLQDCDYLINYDIHWNPVRILQRFGRIDRIGSQNKCIQLVNYWPDIELDEYINLKNRVQNRMVIANVASTGHENVLLDKQGDLDYRAEQMKRLQDEVVDLEDIKTGVSITDLGLNDFHMDLLGYMNKNKEAFESLPTGLHAVVPAHIVASADWPQKQNLGAKDVSKVVSNDGSAAVPGAVFVLRNREASINVQHHNRLHPYYMVYITNKGHIVMDHMQEKKLLDRLRKICRGHSTPLADACRRFNKITQDGQNMTAYSKLLEKSIQSIIAVKKQKDEDSLFTGTKTTALAHAIKGLDDFELIAFLVVQDDKKS